MLARLGWTRREERRWIRQAVRKALADLEQAEERALAPPPKPPTLRLSPAKRRRRRAS